MILMKTTLTSRGQTAVPAGIRKRYNLRPGMRLYWLDTGREIKIVPLPENPIEALYSSTEKKLVKKLLAERQKDKK